MRAPENGNWRLYPYEVAQIAPLFVVHDEQLETWRAERYHEIRDSTGAWGMNDVIAIFIVASVVVGLLLLAGIAGVVIFCAT